MNTRLLVLIVMAIALAAAACGSSSDDIAPAAAPTTEVPMPTEPPTTTPPNPTTTLAVDDAPSAQAITRETSDAVDAFIEAMNNYDADAVYELAANASPIVVMDRGPYGLGNGSLEITAANLTLEQALQSVWELDSCTPGDDDRTARCVVNATGPLRETIGLPPLTIDLLVATADDGTTSRFRWAWSTETRTNFGNYWYQDLEPFFTWLEDSNPGASEGLVNPVQGGAFVPNTSPETVTLWATYVAEFLASQ